MKRNLIIMVFAWSIFILTSCNIDDTEISDKIVAPENVSTPIYGKWVIEDYRLGNIDSIDEETAKGYIGMEAIFHRKIAAIGEDYCINPLFRIKNINASDYLVYQYRMNPESLNIDKTEIQVVSIANEEQFFHEFIRESEETIIVNIDGAFFYLNKISNQVDDEDLKKYSQGKDIAFNTVNIKNDTMLDSGALIGLKSPDIGNDGSIENWNYRTIWIRGQNMQIGDIYSIEDILLPRKTGFWKVEIHREDIDGKVNDRINIYPKSKTIEPRNQRIKIKENDEDYINADNTIKNILYIGNDYLSLEKVDYLNKGERLLEFYPIDYIDRGKPVKISDISGQIGQEAFIKGADEEIRRGKDYKKSFINLRPPEESFGLFRRNGHWIYKGRFNFIKDSKYMYKDFNIKCVPSKEIVHYDELPIPWNIIKSKIPEAVDAFISPNEDIAIITTRSNILIYLIDKGKIADNPKAKIQFKTAEKIIMFEWATGRYPTLWEEEFLKNQAAPI